MEYTLKNNIKLIYKKTTSNLTSISISIDAGACKEKHLLGVAHATEHMVYKGTKNRTEEKINKDLSKVFGFQNAMTNFPYVIYYGTMLNEDFEIGTEIFSDIILNPIFPSEGFEEEMKVIMEELKEWDEDLEQFCEDKLFINSFKNRRIKYPIIGKADHLKKIKLEDIKGFYKENYLPYKTSIAVVSSLEFENVKNIIEKYFEAWENSECEEINEKIIYDKDYFGVYKDKREGSNSCKVQIIFPIDKLNHDEIKALRIFNEYFGEGVNSLLFDTLRTKNGLVYDILTKISYEKYIKLYKITYNTSKENLEKTLELINKCVERIDEFKKVTNDEDIRNYIKAMKLRRWFREEQNIILAKELSTYNTMFGDYKVYSEEFNNLINIDKKYILNVVKKVFKDKSIEIIYS
ncbi:MAG: insulinase family protein [Clostridium sp.]|uniref:M16 family metallopeptidase n=1 Tax=Clostridium sp. TaxID=1506 RepID=UPI0025DD2C15|nr:pitrilysin family protein [Clostridium sp.]MCI6693326.1 insulinase family protein [Clostridium sp.]MDY2632784.1 pitrilysin family protein [Clostridium sp.]MDY6227810.1 pitrilysin family protein [Clostridium sp.]